MKAKLLGSTGIIAASLIMLAVVVSCMPPQFDMPSYWMPMGWSPFLGFPFGLIAIGLYFLPTILAAARHKRSMLGIVLLNVFAGWTIVGWIIALIWSLLADK